MSKALLKMSGDELVAENQRLGAEIDSLRERRLEIKGLLDARDAARRATQLLDGLSDVQIEAVAAMATAKREG